MKNIFIKRLFCIIFLIIFLLNGLNSFSQKSVIDSLEKVFKITTIDSSRVNLLNDMAWELRRYDVQQAMEKCTQAIEISKKIANKYWLADSYMTRGTINKYKADYDQSIKDYFLALNYFEKLNKEKKIYKCYGNLGIIYSKINQLDIAIYYLSKTLAYYIKNKESGGIAASHTNLGQIYELKNDFSRALSHYNQALKIAEQSNYKMGMATSYTNIGSALMRQNKLDESEFQFVEALKISVELGDVFGEASALSALGDICKRKKKPAKALEYFKRSLIISEKNQFQDLILKNNKLLSNNYVQTNDYRNAYEYLLRYATTYDTLSSAEMSKQISEMQTKYETGKKIAEIKLLNKDKQVKELEISKKKDEVRKQRIFIFSFLGGFLIVAFLSVMLFRLYAGKKKANQLLIKRNAEISQQKEEIQTQRDEIETQRDILTEQKAHIEEIHSELTDSIVYAERIQRAVLPSNDYLKEKIQFEHFVLFKPKDIVSGDFYFVEKLDNWLVVCVADCTGHGVPGGFMSMLGISFLQEIITRTEVRTASEVLNLLRNYIVNSLQQKGALGEQKDGMDISFVVIDINSQTTQVLLGSEQSETCEVFTAQFAGANNPLWILKKQHTALECKSDAVAESSVITLLPIATANCQLVEIKGDKQPIGIHERMIPFTNHEVQLQKGDTIYLMSDGYEDQFGGVKGKKFLSKNLKQLLIDNAEKTVFEQQQMLNITIENWKNNYSFKYEQTDDITIFGIRI